jgi:hypothetical protein
MGLTPTIPRYNVNRGNNRSSLILINSSTTSGIWKMRLYKSYSSMYPRFGLVFGAENNTSVLFEIYNNNNGTLESVQNLGAFSIPSSAGYYYLDICNNVLTFSETNNYSGGTSQGVFFTISNTDLNNIVSIDGNNEGHSNVTGELYQVSCVPGCVSSSLNPNVDNPWTQTSVKVTVAVLATFTFIFMILFIVFCCLYAMV